MTTPSDAKELIAAAAELAKAVPVYNDAIQPGAKQIGQSLETVGRALNAALLPLKGMIWGFEQISDYVQKRVTEKLAGTPPENIKSPDPAVAGPALEALRYTAHQEDLREMYANLLASAIDERSASTAHPGFVEILRNMSSEEAKILTYLSRSPMEAFPVINIRRFMSAEISYTYAYRCLNFIGSKASCEYPQYSATYLENLERLGLINLSYDSYLSDEKEYDAFRDNSHIQFILKALNEKPPRRGDIQKGRGEVTVFGLQFINACVIDRTSVISPTPASLPQPPL